MFKKVANYYDLIMSEFDYKEMVDYLDDLIIAAGGERTNLLDLACGTAEELMYFRQLGYKVVGIDNSEDMLKIAREKHFGVDFFNQDITKFRMDEKFDNIISTFDSVNYITDEAKLGNCFKLAYQTLNDKGVFLFDFNTLYGLIKEWEGNQTEENPDFYLVYESDFDYDYQISNTNIKFFIKDGENYIHFEELHREKGYTKEIITKLLKKAGFKKIKFYPFLKKKAVKTSRIDRYQVVAVK